MNNAKAYNILIDLAIYGNSNNNKFILNEQDTCGEGEQQSSLSN